MKSFLRWIPAAALIWATAGCALFGPSYRGPAVFDLPAPAVSENGAALPECELGTVRNLSGADRRFLFRMKDGRMEPDEYSRWLLSPDRMFERRLGEALTGGSSESELRNYLRIGATIRRFEFDRRENAALLDVEFTVREFRDRLPQREKTQEFRIRAPIAGGGDAADCAAAMGRCFDEAAADVRKMIENFNANRK